MDENENNEQVITNRLDFLYSAALKLYSTNPESSGFLILEFIRLAAKENVHIPLSVTSTFCHKCGSLSLPGVNANVEVHTKGHPNACILNPNRKSKEEDKIINYIIYTCKICHSIAQINGLSEKELEKMKLISSNTNLVQKKKKKKKNSSSLVDMLSKQQDPKENTYSLNDFLEKI